MAGYVIHIAIAQEYLRKHNEAYDPDFIRGSVLPDLTKDKSQTHYGKSPSYTNLKKFLDNNKLDTQIKRGEFLHLVSDYLFYNYYIVCTNREQLHNDYDCINKDIIEKYNVKLIDEVKEKVFYSDNIPVILSKIMAFKVIDEISNLDIDDVKDEVLNNKEKWNYYRNLI